MSASSSSMAIRAGRPDDAAELTELALRSKAHWGYSDAFMAACRAELTVSPEQFEDRNFRVRVAELGDRRVGYHAIERQPGGGYELDALFVAPDFIGSGLGRRLLEDARHIARDWGARELLIQGDPNAAGFYEAMGAVLVGTRPSGSIDGRELPLYRLTLAG